MKVQNSPLVNIKGIREGLLITLGDCSYGELIHELTAELGQKQAFLQGSKMVLQLGNRALLRSQLSEIQTLFEQHDLTLWTVLADHERTRSAARQLGLATRLSGSHTDLEGKALPSYNGPSSGSEFSSESSLGQNGLILKETLRSGRSIYHDGHIIIIGDVNPGAEVIAGGDVIVWGRLRGLVHAGAMGDLSAVICALHLSPTQLRIADQIAVPPDEYQRRAVPEQVFIRAGQIVAEPWQPRT